MTTPVMSLRAFATAAFVALINVSLLKAQEEPYFALLVSPDASVKLKNVSSTDFALEGYFLIGEPGLLDPSGWHPIGQQYLDDPDRIIDLLGQGFIAGNLVFGEDIGSDFQRLGEWQGPIMDWGADLSIAIGKPFGEDVSEIMDSVNTGDITWQFLPSLDIPTTQFPIWFIPEPSGLALAGLACLGLLVAARRRRSRGAVM